MKTHICGIITILLILCACDSPQDATEPPVSQVPPVSFSEIPESPAPSSQDMFDLSTLSYLGSDGDTSFYWEHVDTDCVVYSQVNNDIERIAVFPPSYDYPVDIVDFGVCGDWLILSVGQVQGTANIFYGDFVRMKHDGSGLEHFWLTEDAYFHIDNGWVYYDCWYQARDYDIEQGPYRIRPDGSDKQYLDEEINVILYVSDGYVYYGYMTGERHAELDYEYTDLVMYNPDDGEIVTLFSGKTLPTYHADECSIGYIVRAVEDGKVYFTAYVHGYSEGDSWRGHIIDKWEYSANIGGGGLELVSEG